MMLLEFEWDEKKNAINIMKHGVSFDDAKAVFFDSERFEFYDEGHSFFEDRWLILGLSGWELLMVSCTERKGRIRIISARKATKNEEEEYFNGYGTSNSFCP
ncbi:MAG: BrnT family toxin [Treponema sp.]|jgi:uncharacterized DUF497 family protein|nr:BrnT family toxin [Treponema sp.]